MYLNLLGRVLDSAQAHEELKTTKYSEPAHVLIDSMHFLCQVDFRYLSVSMMKPDCRSGLDGKIVCRPIIILDLLYMNERVIDVARQH